MVFKAETCYDNIKINNKIVALDGIYLNLMTKELLKQHSCFDRSYVQQGA
jgi:hypothetical protein